MNLRSDSFRPYDWLDPRLALGVRDPHTHVRLGSNRNPHLAWSDPPAGTQGFALICVDLDCPSEGSRVNKEGATVPVDLPRVRFYHWLLADLPADLREIGEGTHSREVTPHGKPPGPSPSGGRQGVNDYTGWFASDPAMSGTWAGYDGPCPPWNDERVHGYRFELHALDVLRLPIADGFGGPDLEAALRGHVLASASLMGLYRLMT